jgi:uncharacterized membrane protein
LKDNWVDIAISVLLRTGVLLSVGVIIVGTAITFVHHPEYVSSRPALGTLTAPSSRFLSTISDVVAGVRRGSGQAVVMAGLLLLIATPVARVALSIVVFVIERDRLYAVMTTAVLLILLIAFALGRAGG